MKQLVQNLATGDTLLLEVPAPQVRRDHLLIKTTKSLVSPGTERMLVKFSKSGWLEKAIQQPERLRLVIEKMKTNGIRPTIRAVLRKLHQPVRLGYCNVGIVVEVGEGIGDIRVGDRVVSNGSHAEIVCIDRNLVHKIPDNVPDEEAAFTVVGAIALNAIKLLKPELMTTIVVIGAGLIGLLTIEILRASGLKPIVVDIDEEKLEIARSMGFTAFNSNLGDLEYFVMELTGGKGVEGVIITASSKSSHVISQAAKISGRHGKIVLVGAVGLHINRVDFYEKELQFQVACAYGEKSGKNPILSNARQNFGEILGLMSAGKLPVTQLIAQHAPLNEFEKIYQNIQSFKGVASMMDYPGNKVLQKTVGCGNELYSAGRGKIGIIGAGNFVTSTLLPLIRDKEIKYIASESGLSGVILARKFNLPYCTTDYQEILKDPEVDLVMICTRHREHAKMVSDALIAGKHVFVEKPLVIFPEELDHIIKVRDLHHKGSLNVGFNRRFAPFCVKMKSVLGHAPMNVTATMNAGPLDPKSWIHDRETGGGRIISEACHLIDLITFLTGSPITAICMNALGTNPSELSENASILLRYENGSTGTVHYFSNGSTEYAKERVEVYSQGQTLIMDNFKTLRGYGFKCFSKINARQDKGHKAQFRRLLENVKIGKEPLIPFAQVVNVTKATFGALESLLKGAWVEI